MVGLGCQSCNKVDVIIQRLEAVAVSGLTVGQLASGSEDP